MNSVDTARDVAVLWTLDFDAELPCESEHFDPNNPPCSGKATHVAKFICDGGMLLVCDRYALYAKNCIAASDSDCAECDRPCAECWSIRPI